MYKNLVHNIFDALIGVAKNYVQEYVRNFAVHIT